MNFYTHKHYEHILSTALEKNWKFKYFKFSEFKKKNFKTCFLRHDCDHNLIAAKSLSEIENKLGVKSTYFLRLDAPFYNLFCSEQQNLVNQIINKGHLIGLHYTYDYKKSQRWNNETIKSYLDYLKKKFKKITTVISFHQPNNDILLNKRIFKYNHTYEKKVFGNFTYRSDSNLRMIKDGCVSKYFKIESQTLQLLIHPEWWTKEITDPLEKWIQMYEDNLNLSQQNLLRTEKLYKKKLKIKILEK